jgi:hypothetical protein
LILATTLPLLKIWKAQRIVTQKVLWATDHGFTKPGVSRLGATSGDAVAPSKRPRW